jgi:hypothetical protein
MRRPARRTRSPGRECFARSLVRDKGSFGDHQHARCAATRCIVLDAEICGRVLAVPPVSGHRGHNHSVLESDCAELDGLEKLGCSHCSKASVSRCIRGLLGSVVAA